MSTSHRARLLAVSTATPRATIDQRDAERIIPALTVGDDRVRAVRALYRRSGVGSRGCAALDDHGGFSFYEGAGERGPTTAARMLRYFAEAVPIAVEAARGALRASESTRTRITHLVTASCTGFHAPGIEHALIRELGLPASVSRTNIGFMGCHAAVNALAVARAFALADAGARVLVCCAEISSVHLRFSDEPSAAVANALFADGAAAAVVTASSEHAAPAVLDAAGVVIPDSAGEMAWRVGDHGFEMHLSGKVPDILAKHAPAWIDALLARHGLDRHTVRGWALHPGGPRVLASLAAALDLAPGSTVASRDVLAAHGNMSSATILFIIDRLLRTGVALPMLAAAFGPGLCGEALLLSADA